MTCIQYIDVTFRNGKWEFDQKSGLNNCILNNDQGSLPPDRSPDIDVPDDTPPGQTPPGQTPPGTRPPGTRPPGNNGKNNKDKGTNLLIYGGIGFIILIIVIIVIVSATRSNN